MYLSVRRPYPAPWMEWAFVAKPSPFYTPDEESFLHAAVADANATDVACIGGCAKIYTGSILQCIFSPSRPHDPSTAIPISIIFTAIELSCIVTLLLH